MPHQETPPISYRVRLLPFAFLTLLCAFAIAAFVVKERMILQGNQLPPSLFPPLIAGALSIALVWSLFLWTWMLARRAVAVPATILNVSSLSMYGFRRVSLSYRFEGVLMESCDSVHGNQAKHLSVGKEIPILVDPRKPDRFVIPRMTFLGMCIREVTNDSPPSANP
jgi:hypothetical protein